MPSTPYNYGTGMKCVKYMLLTINSMFLLTAILLILVGTTIQAIYGEFEMFIDGRLFSPPAVMVAAGAILFLVASFGCFGAMRESTMLINVYGLLLAVIFLLELGAAISACILQGKIKDTVERTLKDSLNNYEKDPHRQQQMDMLQNTLKCCGVYDEGDWHGILSNTTLLVPPSCCERDCETDHPTIHQYGCLRMLNWVIAQSTWLVATGAITVAFVQILGIVCAFMLAKTIRRTKTMREVRRWQLQQSLGILATGGKNLDTNAYTELSKSPSKDATTYTSNNASVN